MADAASRAGAEVRDTVETFRRTLARAKGGLLAAFAVLTVARLVFQTPGWVVGYLARDAIDVGRIADADDYALAGVCTGLFQVAGNLALGAVGLGMLRTVRVLSVAGRTPAGGAVEILQRASRRYLHVLGLLVLMSLACAIGTLLCGVGLLAVLFVLLPAPYLVTARELSIGEALPRSLEIARSHPAPVAASVAGLVALGVLVGAIAVALQAGLLAALGPAGVLAASPLAFLLSSGAMYLALVWVGALGATLDKLRAAREPG